MGDDYKENNPYKTVSSYVSKKVYEKLKELETKARKYNIPVARLIAIAIDNEFDSQNPFNYPCELPENYTEYEYAAEAGRILKYLMSLSGGSNIESLMLVRRELGIESRQALLGGLKELFEKELITEYKWSFIPNKHRYNFGDNYAMIRVKR